MRIPFRDSTTRAVFIKSGSDDNAFAPRMDFGTLPRLACGRPGVLLEGSLAARGPLWALCGTPTIALGGLLGTLVGP